MNLEVALQTFLEEARELLAEMERILLDVESSEMSHEQINALFRAMHTIKGSAGLFGLDGIVSFSHEAENVLDRVRDGEIRLDAQLCALLLRCHDHVKGMLGHVDDPPHLLAMANPPIAAELRNYLTLADSPALLLTDSEPADIEPPPSSRKWVLSLRFGEDVLRNGMDPSSFIRYLAMQGEIMQIVPVISRLPLGTQFDPESNYLRFEILFAYDGSEQNLKEVFEFVLDDSRIHIFAAEDFSECFSQLLADIDEAEQLAVRQAWQQIGLLHETVGARDSDSCPPAIPATEPTVTSAAVAEALPEGKAAKAVESRFIKVEAGKLDNLINLIGELVIAGAAANLMAKKSGQASLVESTVAIASLIEQIRAGTLSMRMVQIGEIFGRFPRVVRDVSKELGKAVTLSVSGSDTELDKSMVDKLADPLMHIVRNAIDHGIEAEAQRLAAGKTAGGHVWLNAFHESGSVVIEVADDGRGLDRERILAKAIDKGLVSAEQTLSDSEIYQLIFAPGFSTAEQVTNLSGRGVGMDVVQKAIDQLRGTIHIDSMAGEGTTFRIHLPLTLAIIDGFQVGIGLATFVLPLEAVIECMELTQALHHEGVHHCLNLRGEVLPMLDLNAFLELGYPKGKRQNVVVVRYGDSKAGLIVDELLGEFQTVIKPMGALFRNLRAISGSTILGSGEVALILDVAALIRYAMASEARRHQLPLGVSGNVS